MPYSAQINRANPTCIVFLIDQSGSMEKPFRGDPGQPSKKVGVADAINKFLQTLCIKCGKHDGIHDYFHIGLIGYGGEKGPSGPEDSVKSALSGPLAGRDLVSISEIAMNPIRVDEREKKISDGAGGILTQKVKLPVWLEPAANGLTPTRKAIDLAAQWVGGFLSKHPDCFPPIVLNLTDGRWTPDEDHPQPAAERLRNLSSTDGNVLFFNAHISSKDLDPILFPKTDNLLQHVLAQVLFNLSSVIPSEMLANSGEDDLVVEEGARGFVFNADLVSIIQFLEIGTSVAPGRTVT